ncbi:MAG: aminotransferase class I/II-fold pyridoxal phosphate-dependent enzyme, partial [Pseudomonadota bacterium]
MTSQYDFDQIIDRRGTHCGKWDGMEKVYGVSPDDGLSMWVADMDFAAPPEVVAALSKVVDHQVYGYFADNSDYLAAITHWMKTRHNWTVENEWIATTHGLVAAVGLALRAFSEPGDGVILFTPVYHAFARMIDANRRTVVESPLALRDGQYHMDLDALAASLTGREKMVIFCSPHNPGGRIWSVEEQKELAAFCEAHDLILICDEVHHDLVYPGEVHTVMPNAAPEVMDRLVMLTASSKTFNLAGGMTGNAIIPNPDLRKAFTAQHMAAGASPNIFGMATATAAYQKGAPWLD